MSNYEEVKSQIAFQLEQLSAKNKHHEFEAICFQIAKLRISSNILPATGPVSSGGDQGRDFETYDSYRSATSIADSEFFGNISDNPIIFCCSLRKDYNQKFKEDIKKNVELTIEISFLSSNDIPVGQRHKLEDWALEKYSTKVQIFDRQAIVDFLSHRELFWIAVQFLNIPSEIYPSDFEGDEDNWYMRIQLVSATG